jgi:hypothetical protein
MMIQHLFRLPSMVALSLVIALGAVGRAASAGGGLCLGSFNGTPLSMAIDGAQAGAATAVAGADVLVGAPGIGSVAVYRRINGIYSVVTTLARPSSILATSSGFGREIAVDGTVAAVGAPFHNSSQGAVVLYSRASDGAWSYLQTINSPLDLANGVFGMSVAMSNGFLAIGAPGAINANGFARGAVYLYERTPAGTYSVVRRFDPVEATASQDKWYGWGVGLGNSTLVVAAPGESIAADSGKYGTMYVYRRDAGGSWNTPIRMKSPGVSGGTFGTALAVGTQAGDGTGVSIFMREQRPLQSDAIWMYSTVLSLPTLAGAFTATATPEFGGDPFTDCVLINSLAIHEGFGLVGSPDDSIVTRYIFNGLSWSYDEFETYPGGGVSSQWGQAVAIGHDHFAVGAPYFSYGLNNEPGLVSMRSHDAPNCDLTGDIDACFISLNGSSIVDLNNDGVPDTCQAVVAPSEVTATEGTRTDGVALAWPSVERAVRYKVTLLTGEVETDVGFAYVPQYIDTAAAAGVLRTYRVRSESAGGVLSVGSVTDTGWRMLDVPTGVAATFATSLSSVTVTWSAVSGATGYKLLRVRGSAIVELPTLGNVLTYSDTTATAGLAYDYFVRATCSLGESALSIGAVGKISDVSIPPATVTATYGTSLTGVTVSWSAVEDAIGYKIVRTRLGVSTTLATVTGVLTYVDTTATPGLDYYYAVRSVCTPGDSLPSTAVLGLIAANATPLSLTATDGTLTTGVTLAWTAVDGGSTGYTILRGEGSKKPKAIATVGASVRTFTDTAVPKPTKIYSYTVRLASQTTGGLVNTGWKAPPGATGLTATDGTLSTGVQLTWVLAPKSSKVTGYQVFRTAPGGTAVFLGSVAKTVKTVTDTGAIPGILYTYSLRPVVALGVTPAITNTGWRTLVTPATLIASDSLTDKISVAWTSVLGATSYLLTRTGGAGEVTFPTVTNSYNDTSAVVGTIYTYRVQAISSMVTTGLSTTDTGTRVASFRLLLAGGSGGGAVGSSGQTATARESKSQDQSSDATSDENSTADHIWLVDGTTIEHGPFVMNRNDAMVIKLRDPTDMDKASMLVLLGEGILDGTLRLTLDGYEPRVDDEWTVILSSGLMGDFRRVLLPALPEGMSMETERVGTIYQVRVIATPE